MSTGARKERLKEQGRQEILGAAMALFAEKGFHGVSMQEVAGRAGFAVGTLYNFFASKEDLYNALMDVCVAGIANILTPILDDTQVSPMDRIKGVIAAHERLVRDNAPYIRLSQSRFSDQGVKAGMGAHSRAVTDRIQQRIAEVFKEGIDKGVFRDMNPVFMAELLRAIMEASAFWAIREPAGMSMTDISKTMETIFLHGIRAQ